MPLILIGLCVTRKLLSIFIFSMWSVMYICIYSISIRRDYKQTNKRKQGIGIFDRQIQQQSSHRLPSTSFLHTKTPGEAHMDDDGVMTSALSIA